ncbi:unnamed protein product, partial [Vitis vinifera]|uniref:Uncharacterized protein n=1 Tax=Vitis vinifera TaxID=29760 RepID=D7SSU5_VITVI
MLASPKSPNIESNQREHKQVLEN